MHRHRWERVLSELLIASTVSSGLLGLVGRIPLHSPLVLSLTLWLFPNDGLFKHYTVYYTL